MLIFCRVTKAFVCLTGAIMPKMWSVADRNAVCYYNTEILATFIKLFPEEDAIQLLYIGQQCFNAIIFGFE